MTISPVTELAALYASNIGGSKDINSLNSNDSDFSLVMSTATKNGQNGSDNLFGKKAYKDEYMENLPISESRLKVDKSEGTFKDNRIRKENDYDNQINNNSNKSDEAGSLKNDMKNNIKESDGNDEDIAMLRNKILNETADALGMSAEELEEILGQLGMVVSDLVIPENVSKLASFVLGSGDVSDILTNEQISDAIMNINSDILEAIDECAELTGIDVDSLKLMLSEQDGKTNILDLNDYVLADTLEMNDTDDENSDANIITDDSVESGDVNNENEVITSNKESNNTKFDNSAENNNNQMTENFSQNTQTQNINQTINVNSEMNMTYSSVDADKILEQVRDNIKASVREDVTELSITLNPENLGNVNLTVAAKEGAITAYLLTENETVSAALESQLAMIKDAINEQGVKVEAIEVMVGTHEFEQNLDGNNQNNEAEEKMKAQLKKATRKLNIGDILADDSNIELDESEIVTAKMMAADGNSMDYKV